MKLKRIFKKKILELNKSLRLFGPFSRKNGNSSQDFGTSGIDTKLSWPCLVGYMNRLFIPDALMDCTFLKWLFILGTLMDSTFLYILRMYTPLMPQVTDFCSWYKYHFSYDFGTHGIETMTWPYFIGYMNWLFILDA